MKKAIIITGTPGTGKTAITNLLKNESYSTIEVGKLVKEKNLYDYYDEERESYVVNDELLNEKLVELLQKHSSSKPLIIDGHVVELPPKHVLHCIVLRCSIRHLRQRLMERNYGSLKIDENVEAEIMEVLLTDMLELYGPENVSVVFSDSSVDETFKQVLSKVKKVSNNAF